VANIALEQVASLDWNGWPTLHWNGWEYSLGYAVGAQFSIFQAIHFIKSINFIAPCLMPYEPGTPCQQSFQVQN
jgi:hypothetical protein